MNAFHEIPFGGPDRLIAHVPAVRVDASPAPTVTIEDLTQSVDSSTRLVVVGPVATPDNFDQPLTAVSGLGTTNPRRVNAVGTAATLGRRYALEGPGGESEIVTAIGMTATWVDTAAPLAAEYPMTTSRLRGLELRTTIPQGVAAREDLLEEERPILVRWRYHVRGRLVVVSDQARIVRALGVEAYLGEVEALLREEWPELVQQLPNRGSGLSALVRGCARQLAVKMRARQIDPGTFMAGPHGLEILLQLCVWHFGLRGLVPRNGPDATTWTDWARGQYLNLWHALVKGKPGRDVVEPTLADDQAPTGHSRRRRNLVALK